MTFNFIKSYYGYKSKTSFKMDIPVGFVIPNSFKSFSELGVLSTNNKEVCDVLSSLGVTNKVLHQVRITKDEVIVFLKSDDYEFIKKMLLRDKLLNDLGL